MLASYFGFQNCNEVNYLRTVLKDISEVIVGYLTSCDATLLHYFTEANIVPFTPLSLLVLKLNKVFNDPPIAHSQ